MVNNLLAMWRSEFDPWVRKIFEKSMATHSKTLVWRTSWTEKPKGLESIGSQRVRYD